MNLMHPWACDRGRPAAPAGSSRARHRRCWLTIVALAMAPAAFTAADEQLAPGVRYRVIGEPEDPQVFHVLEIDRGAAGISFVSSVGAGVRGAETVEQMARMLPAERGRVVPAINGDFFQMGGDQYRGTVQGMTVIDGELASGPGGGHAFCVDREGRPSIEPLGDRFEIAWPDGRKTPLRVNGATSDAQSEVGAADVVLFTPRFDASTRTKAGRELVLTPAPDGPQLPLRVGRIYTATVSEIAAGTDTPIKPGTMVLSLATTAAAAAPAVQPGDTLRIGTAPDGAWADCVTAISGDPVLLARGQIKPAPDAEKPARAIRTAVGYGPKQIVLVAATRWGASHREMAERLHAMGCTDAVNLDGGGSSTMLVNGKSVVPAPGRGQRPVGNALLVVQKVP